MSNRGGKIKIVVEQLQNNNVVKTTLTPLQRLEEVSEILVIRDYPGLKMDKVRYICPRVFMRKYSVLRALSKLFLFISTSIKQKPDVLIGIDMVPHSLNAVIASKFFKIPVIGSLRGMPETYFRGIEKPFMTFILKNLSYLTTTGKKSQRQMGAHYPSERIFVLPNSIDTSVFQAKEGKKEYDIVNIGRLHPSKHIDKFLEIVAIIKKEVPTLKVAIIGNGPAEDELKTLSKKIKLESTVEFLGYESDPQFYYSKSRLFILPTEREGLPMSVIEAMCCGCIPIITKIGDIEDLCVDKVNSRLIEDYKDIDAFATAAIELLNNKELYRRIVSNTSIASEKFNYNNASIVWKEMLRNLGLI